MTGWRFIIPSYRRARTLAEKTLPLVLDRGIEKDRIEIWVAPDEADEYEEIADGVRVCVGEAGLGRQRNLIMGAAKLGQRLVFMDDDMSDVHVAKGSGFVPIRNLSAFIDSAFAVADRAQARLWGVYPVGNAYFMQPTITFDLRYISGGLYGTVARGDFADRVELEDKEDFERTIRSYVMDGRVVRFNSAGYLTRCYDEPGGMQETRTEERVAASAKALVEAYPQHCSLNLTKRSGHAEVRLRDTTGSADAPAPLKAVVRPDGSLAKGR